MPVVRDYSLTGPENARAVERGLATAEWYQSAVPRPLMTDLMTRSNGRAAADTALWLALLATTGFVAHRSWGSWWAVPAFLAYGTLYGSVSDPRWHECGHRTAFRTRWPNDVIYVVAAFMDMREPVSWRWSHTRHHDDTIVVGRDKEIAAKRGTAPWRYLAELVGWFSVTSELRKLGRNLAGRLDPQDADFVPASQRAAAIRSGRLMCGALLVPVVFALVLRSPQPLLFAGILPSMYGRWLLVVYGLTQHAGLAEDVLDHRLNTRTVRMNRINRFLYSNMNFHTEHHMFPSVPYHQLPRMHEAIKADLPPVYDGILAAYREIIPALRRQATDPGFTLSRPLPTRAATAAPAPVAIDGGTGWVTVCTVEELAADAMRRLEHGGHAYAVYRTADGAVFATDARCSHGRADLTQGHLSGTVIECPKHNWRLDITTGRALGAPAIVDVACHRVRVVDGMVQVLVAADAP
jgi:Na+-transporting NADH:ubiquinone oxidoreductase subunit F